MSYPLEQLALIKQKKLEESEKQLKMKKEALQKEEEKLLSIEKERDTVKIHRHDKLTQLRETLDAGTSTDKIQQMKTYLKIVDEQLKAEEQKVLNQKKQVTAAEAQVETARQDFIKRTREVEKLRLHRLEWDQEQKKIEAQLESLENDELGSSMHVRKKSRPKKPPQ